MRNPASASPISLNVRRIYSAAPQRVFRAWTVPAEVQKWWGPGGFTSPQVEIDLRVGGRFRIAMQPPEGDLVYLTGEYREVVPPKKLVFTWQWEGSPDVTLVTLEFADQGGMTELSVKHENFPTQDQCERHDQGWNSMLDRLPGAL